MAHKYFEDVNGTVTRTRPLRIRLLLKAWHDGPMIHDVSEVKDMRATLMGSIVQKYWRDIL